MKAILLAIMVLMLSCPAICAEHEIKLEDGDHVVTFSGAPKQDDYIAFVLKDGKIEFESNYELGESVKALLEHLNSIYPDFCEEKCRCTGRPEHGALDSIKGKDRK